MMDSCFNFLNTLPETNKSPVVSEHMKKSCSISLSDYDSPRMLKINSSNMFVTQGNLFIL